jgi:hypothetical protein
LNNVRHAGSWHFRNKKREYAKDEINELATSFNNENVRDLYIGTMEFEKLQI